MNEKIENLLEENRKFSPSENLVNNANATSDWFTEANEDRIEFWKKQALERITWYKEPTEVLDDSNAPFYKWFKDGELNLSYNCLDRHLETDADRVAFYWEGEPGDTQEITFQVLRRPGFRRDGGGGGVLPAVAVAVVLHFVLEGVDDIRKGRDGVVEATHGLVGLSDAH